MNAKFLLVVAFASIAPVAWCDNAKEEAKLIDGVWIPVEAELGGQKLPDDQQGHAALSSHLSAPEALRLLGVLRATPRFQSLRRSARS